MAEYLVQLKKNGENVYPKIKGKTLYNTDTQSNFSLSETKDNFSKLEIEFGVWGSTSGKSSVVVDTKIGSSIEVALLTLTKTSTHHFFETCSIGINGTSVTFNGGGQLTLDDLSSGFYATNQIHVYKVIGYK